MKKEILKFLVLAMLAVGAGPVSAAVWQWSRTATSNATADATINWAEGMSPSSVNDSARSMMARVAEWRDDISGSVATAGTSTAITLSTNQLAGGNGIGSPPADGQMLAFRATLTNGGAATLAVDGGTAYPLHTSAGTAASAGTLIAGTPYRVSFNLAAGKWVIEGGGQAYSIPLGGLLPYTGGTAPNSNFILPAGQCISTATYATYWALMGSPAAGSCAGGQFQVVDLRGRVLAGLDNLNGTLASRMTAAGCGVALTSVGAACTQTETFTLLNGNLPPYTPGGSNGTTIAVNSTASNVLVGTVAFQTFNYSSGGGSLLGAIAAGTLGGGTLSSSGTAPTFTGNAQGGTSTPVPRVQPTIAVTYLLRVL